MMTKIPIILAKSGTNPFKWHCLSPDRDLRYPRCSRRWLRSLSIRLSGAIQPPTGWLREDRPYPGPGLRCERGLFQIQL